MSRFIPDGVSPYEFIKKVASHLAHLDWIFLSTKCGREILHTLTKDRENIHYRFLSGLSAPEREEFEKLPPPLQVAVQNEHYSLLTCAGKTATAYMTQYFPLRNSDLRRRQTRSVKRSTRREGGRLTANHQGPSAENDEC